MYTPAELLRDERLEGQSRLRRTMARLKKVRAEKALLIARLKKLRLEERELRFVKKKIAADYSGLENDLGYGH